MAIALQAQVGKPDEVDAIGIPCYGDLALANGESFDQALAGQRGFAGALGEAMVVSGAGTTEIFVGLGPRDKVDLEALRRAGAAFARATRGRVVALDVRGLVVSDAARAEVAQACCEGAALALYRYDELKSAPPSPSAERLVLVADDAEALAAGCARAAIVVEAVSLARDLINRPPSMLTPEDFADVARSVATQAGLTAVVFDEHDLARENCGGILGVGRGSHHALPRLVRLEYTPRGVNEKTPCVALVGKGITFDSGGLSLKSPESMTTMKTDMSGAAAVLAVLGACSAVGVDCRVVGFMPLAENMPGGDATKPGDVLKIANGKTIEVLNTDAEGRLVLADALSLAVEEHPDAIIDLATLTGACIVALGAQIAGCMGNDDRLIDAVRAAATRAGEPTWPLPLPEGYRSHIDSDVADMKNTGASGQAGTLSAGLLLEEFVGTAPWVHLDIAGPARAREGGGYLPKGATGFGVRTLLELLDSYEALGGEASGASSRSVLR